MDSSRASKNLLSATAAAFLIVAATNAAPAHLVTGRFDVYCNDVGFFLAKVGGAPAPGSLFLLVHTDIRYVPNEKWIDVTVYPDECFPGGKCQALGHGRIRLDNDLALLTKSASGEYEIEVSRKQLRGRFAVKRRPRGRKQPLRVCE